MNNIIRRSSRVAAALTAGIATAVLATGGTAAAASNGNNGTGNNASPIGQTVTSADVSPAYWGGELHFTHRAHIRTGPSTGRASVGIGQRGEPAQWKRAQDGQQIHCPDRNNLGHTRVSRAWYHIRDSRTGTTGWTSACFLNGSI